MGETFNEAFPHYLAMGMSYSDYWENDCTMVIAYRKAFQIRQEQENQFAWLQGMYIYEAFCDVAPVLHAFAKSGTKVRPYSSKPYQFSSQQSNAVKQKRKEKSVSPEFAKMHAFVEEFNRGFIKRQAEKKAKQAREGVTKDV